MSRVCNFRRSFHGSCVACSLMSVLIRLTFPSNVAAVITCVDMSNGSLKSPDQEWRDEHCTRNARGVSSVGMSPHKKRSPQCPIAAHLDKKTNQSTLHSHWDPPQSSCRTRAIPRTAVGTAKPSVVPSDERLKLVKGSRAGRHNRDDARCSHNRRPLAVLSDATSPDSARPRAHRPAVAPGLKEVSMARKLPALFVVGLVFAILSVGCAQTAPRERDLNAEAMHQMSWWGDFPGS